MKLRALVFAVLLAAPTLTPAAALASGAAARGDDWASVTALSPGEKLVVDLKDGRTVKGKLSRVSDEGLSLDGKGGAADVRRESVLRVYLVTGGTRRKSALIGAAVGAGAGAAWGARYATESLDSFSRNRGRAVAGTSLLAAGVFGGVGALIGRALGRGESRELIYRAP